MNDIDWVHAMCLDLFFSAFYLFAYVWIFLVCIS